MITVSDYDQKNYTGSGNKGSDGLSAMNIGRRSSARTSARQTTRQTQQRTASVSSNTSNAAYGTGSAGQRSVQSRTQPRPNLDVRLNTGFTEASRSTASQAGSRSAAMGQRNSGGRSQQTAGGTIRTRQTDSTAGTRSASGIRTSTSGVRSGSSAKNTSGVRNNASARNSASSDPKARARAAARRRKKQQQKMIMRLGLLAVLFVALIVVIVGVRSHIKTTKMNTFRESGITAMDEGRYEDAIESFDQALTLAGGKIDKIQTDILQRRAEAEYNLKDYAASLDSWKILMETDPTNDEYKKNAVLCMMETGQYEEALQVGLMQSRIYNKMAVEKIKAGDYEGALTIIDQGLAVDDGSAGADLLYNKAVAHESRGNYEEALQIFREYVSRYGTDENVQKEITFLETRVDSTETESSEAGDEETNTESSQEQQ
jgi:outer membrane protein assembly factor BamD (BamD/ComL family)